MYHCSAVQGKVGEPPIFQCDCANTHPFPGDIPAVGKDKNTPGKSLGNTLSMILLTWRELNKGYVGSSLLARRSYTSSGIESVGTLPDTRKTRCLVVIRLFHQDIPARRISFILGRRVPSHKDPMLPQYPAIKPNWVRGHRPTGKDSPSV